MRTTKLFALAALLSTACPEKRVDGRPAAHHQEALATTAELFWYSLRWNDSEAAAAVLEQTDTRLDFLTLWTTEPPEHITDFQIVHVEVLDNTVEDARLEGLVVVKVEAIERARNVVDVEMIRQTWYQSGDNWYLDPDSLPFQSE